MAHHWTKICCPVDFSETSREALAQAVDIAAHGSARLVILHAYERAALGAAGEVLVTDPDLEDRLVHELNEQIERYRLEAERAVPGRVVAEATCGEAATEIVRFAERAGCDLIVMGTHGRSGIRRLVIGSVAESVVRHAPCSVLVVRPPQFRIEPD